MKSKLIILSLVVILSSGARFVFAHEGHEDGDEKGSAVVDRNSMGMTDNKIREEAKAIEVGNKICPVSGEKVPVPGQKSSMGGAVKYEYNGKIYNLCCPMCIKDFKKDPKKYSKIAEDEVKNQKNK